MPIPSNEDRQKLIDQLTTEEGKRKFPYKDTVGKLTIGVGRNLTDRGLSEDEIRYLLINDLKIVEQALDDHLSWWRNLDLVRQRVLMDMCFNMGVETLLEFKNTLHYIQTSQWAQASSGMLKSRWASEVGDRAKRLAKMMETGNELVP